MRVRWRVAQAAALLIAASLPGTSAQGGIISLLQGLHGLTSEFRPIGDIAGGPLGLFTPRLGQQASGGGSPRGSSGSGGGEPIDQCGRLKSAIFNAIDVGLRINLAYTVQEGILDFGFFGDAGETDACGGQNCAYTNPSSPYGLTVLPLSPSQSAAKVEAANTTPSFVKNDMQQRAASSSSASNGTGSGLGGGGTGAGDSAAWQLLPDEVVVLAGCVPPANASRYFALTSYLHSLWNNKTSNWLSIFSALGDSIGAYQLPLNNGSLPFAGIRNRLNSSLPGAATAAALLSSNSSNGTDADFLAQLALGNTSASAEEERLLGGGGLLGAFGQWLGNRTSGRKLAQLEGLAGAQQQQATRAAAQAAGALLAQATAGGRRGGNNSQATSSAPPKPSWSLWEALPDQLPSLSTWRDPRSRDAAGASSAGGAQDGFDGYYSSISEPDITAFSGPPDYEGINSTTIKSNSYGNSSVNVTGTRRHDPQGDPYGQFTLVIMTASQAAATRVQALLAPVLQRVGLQGSVNVLPIGGLFTQGIGLSPTSPYFMLLARNIIGQGQLPAFKAYLDGQPWKAWRLTPRLLGSSPQATLTPGAPGSYPLPSVIPRNPPPSIRQSEDWLRPAYEWLMGGVQDKLENQSYTLNWGLGSDSALQVAGVDWGVQCYQLQVDYCNGDNRDAQYITALPTVTLDTMDKVLYLVGVNHVATGLAAYVNVAPSDPIQRLGLASWDDQEMRGSADAYLAGGPYAALAPAFFVVAYSRNCTGIPYCKEIPMTGARSLPLNRAMLVILRAYVNPATGVGPNSTALVTFNTVVATPRAEATPKDTHARSNVTLRGSPCIGSLVLTALTCSAELFPNFEFGSNVVTDLASGNAGALRGDAAAAAANRVGAAGGAPADGGGAGGGPLRSAVRNAVTGGNDGGATSSASPSTSSSTGVAGFGLFNLLQRPPADSKCCVNTAAWGAQGCWCSAAGQVLLDSLAPVPARSMLVGLGRLCSQPVIPSVAACVNQTG